MTVMDYAEAREQVRRGAARLDVVRPAWFLQVRFSQLEVDRFDRCILAQVFGDYIKGRSIAVPLSRNIEDISDLYDDQILRTIDYGFTWRGIKNDAWGETMNELWQQEVAQRVANQGAEC